MDFSRLAELNSKDRLRNDFPCERARQPQVQLITEGWVSFGDTQPFRDCATRNINSNSSLFPYSEHLGPAHGTYALSGRPAVLHDYASGILHFSLGAALHAVCLHLFTSLFVKE
jgi:hypothetical protein